LLQLLGVLGQAGLGLRSDTLLSGEAGALGLGALGLGALDAAQGLPEGLGGLVALGDQLALPGDHALLELLLQLAADLAALLAQPAGGLLLRLDVGHRRGIRGLGLGLLEPLLDVLERLVGLLAL